MSAIRVLIVDDEPAARRGVRSLLTDRDDATLVGEAGTVDEARTQLEELRPDVVFLDVRMPGGSGLDAVRFAGPGLPVVVLVTAHEEHAIEAFDVEAVDYLLKPFTDAEFERALERASRQVHRIRVEGVGEQLADLVAELHRGPGSPDGWDAGPGAEHREGGSAEPSGATDRIPIRYGERVLIIDRREILWIGAEGDYVRIHTPDGDHLLRATMREMERRLGARFVRIHRSSLVRLDEIREIRPRGRGRYTVVLSDGERRDVSPRGYEALRGRLGL